MAINWSYGLSRLITLVCLCLYVCKTIAILDSLFFFILQYKLRDSDCSSLTLWVSVWDYDKFGRNRFLGEVYLQLDTMDLTDPQSHWYRLMDQVSGWWHVGAAVTVATCIRRLNSLFLHYSIVLSANKCIFYQCL